MANTIEDHNTKTSYLKSIKDTIIDPEYDLESHWIPNLNHPYSYMEYNTYNEKRIELEKKNRSTDEQLGFLLLPSKFGLSTYLPSLDTKFMRKLCSLDCGLSETLGKFDEGVVLFTSIDVVLKLASFKRFRCAKVAVYKFIPGRTKIKMCDITNCLDPEPIDSMYDSLELELNNNLQVSQLNLDYQLRFTEIFLYDIQVHQNKNLKYKFPSGCPRQTTPLTIIEFIAKRPFIIPRMVLKRKERVILPKNSLFYVANPVPAQGKKLKRVLPKGHVSIAPHNVETLYNHAPNRFFNPPVQNPIVKKKRGRPRKNKKSSANENGNIDVLGQAALMSGLCGETSIEQHGSGFRELDHGLHFTVQESNAPTCSKYLLQENGTSENITVSGKIIDSSRNDDYISSVENLDQILRGFDGQSMLSFCEDAGIDLTKEPVQQEVINPVQNESSVSCATDSLNESDSMPRNLSLGENVSVQTQSPVLMTPVLSTNCVSVQTNLQTGTTDKDTQTLAVDVINDSLKSKIREGIDNETVFDLLESLLSEHAGSSTPKISERMNLSSTLSTPEYPCHVSYQSSLLATPPMSNAAVVSKNTSNISPISCVTSDYCQTSSACNSTPKRVAVSSHVLSPLKIQNARRSDSLNTPPCPTLRCMSPHVTLERCASSLPSTYSKPTANWTTVGDSPRIEGEDDAKVTTSSERGSRYDSPLRNKNISTSPSPGSSLRGKPKIEFRRQKNGPFAKYLLEPTKPITLQSSPMVQNNIFALRDLPNSSSNHSARPKTSSFISDAMKVHKKVNSYRLMSQRSKRKLQDDSQYGEVQGIAVNANHHSLESNNMIGCNDGDINSHIGTQQNPLPPPHILSHQNSNHSLLNQMEKEGFPSSQKEKLTQDQSSISLEGQSFALEDVHSFQPCFIENGIDIRRLPLNNIYSNSFNGQFKMSMNSKPPCPALNNIASTTTASTQEIATPDHQSNGELNKIVTHEKTNVLEISSVQAQDKAELDLIDKLPYTEVSDKPVQSKNTESIDPLVICEESDNLLELHDSNGGTIKLCEMQNKQVNDLGSQNFGETNKQNNLSNLDDKMLSTLERNKVEKWISSPITSTDVLISEKVSDNKHPNTHFLTSICLSDNSVTSFSSDNDSLSVNARKLEHLISGQLNSDSTELEENNQTTDHEDIHHSQVNVDKENVICHTGKQKSNTLMVNDGILQSITKKHDEKSNDIYLHDGNQEISPKMPSSSSNSLIHNELFGEKIGSCATNLFNKKTKVKVCENVLQSDDDLDSTDSLSSINAALDEDVKLMDSSISADNIEKCSSSNANNQYDSLAHVKETNLNTVDESSFKKNPTDVNNNIKTCCITVQVPLLDNGRLEPEPITKSTPKSVNTNLNISLTCNSNGRASIGSNIRSTPEGILPDNNMFDTIDEDHQVSMLPEAINALSKDDNEDQEMSSDTEVPQHGYIPQTNVSMSPTFTAFSTLGSESSRSNVFYYGQPLIKSRKTSPRIILKKRKGDPTLEDPRLKVTRSSSKSIDLQNVNWLQSWLSSINKGRKVFDLPGNVSSEHKTTEGDTTAEDNFVNPASLYRINLLLNKENDCQSVYSECRDEHALQDLIPFMTSPCHYIQNADKPTGPNSNKILTSTSGRGSELQSTYISENFQYFPGEKQGISKGLTKDTSNFNDHGIPSYNKKFSLNFNNDRRKENDAHFNLEKNYKNPSLTHYNTSYNSYYTPTDNLSYPACESTTSIDQSSQPTASYLDGLNLSIYDELGTTENAYLKEGKSCNSLSPHREKNMSHTSNAEKNCRRINNLYGPNSTFRSPKEGLTSFGNNYVGSYKKNR